MSSLNSGMDVSSPTIPISRNSSIILFVSLCIMAMKNEKMEIR